MFTRTHRSITMFTSIHYRVTRAHRSMTMFTRAHWSMTMITRAHRSITMFARALRSITMFSIAHRSITVFRRAHRSITMFTRAYRSITVFTRAHRSITMFTRAYRSITVFTRAHPVCLFWAKLILFMLSHPIPLGSILMLSSHLCLGFQLISYFIMFFSTKLPVCLFLSPRTNKIWLQKIPQHKIEEGTSSVFALKICYNVVHLHGEITTWPLE
jgi:hypothetical protein